MLFGLAGINSINIGNANVGHFHRQRRGAFSDVGQRCHVSIVLILRDETCEFRSISRLSNRLSSDNFISRLLKNRADSLGNQGNCQKDLFPKQVKATVGSNTIIFFARNNLFSETVDKTAVACLAYN